MPETEPDASILTSYVGPHLARISKTHFRFTYFIALFSRLPLRVLVSESLPDTRRYTGFISATCIDTDIGRFPAGKRDVSACDLTKTSGSTQQHKVNRSALACLNTTLSWQESWSRLTSVYAGAVGATQLSPLDACHPFTL